MIIEEIREVTDEVVEAFERLIPQLTIYSPPPTRQQLKEMVSARCTVLLAARAEPASAIIGLLALVVARAPTGVRAWFEDVVVEESERGKGYGEALLRAGMARAQQAGAKLIELTSGPRREAANRLYLRLGFVYPNTNLFRYTFPIASKEKK
jgi:GNAT superfamily N-acetyltransferase